MFLEIKIVDVVTKTGRFTKRRIMILQCDACGITFEQPYVKHRAEQSSHSHSLECRNICLAKGGKAAKKREETCVERYGYENAWHAEPCVEKAKQTMLELYGAEHPLQSQILIEKKKQTCLDRFGVDHQFKSPEIIAKIEETNLERYGATNVFASDIIKQRIKETHLENHGVEHVSQVPMYREKIKQTLLERYGVEVPAKSPVILAKMLQTVKDRYGADCAYMIPHVVASRSTPEVALKRHHTMIQNGSYTTSKPENECYELLCELFGDHGVERQYLVNNKWKIDFYIKCIDTYVQLDGEYWHGLDRPIDEIKELNTQRSNHILGCIKTDAVQNDWFSRQNLRLVRITDKEFYADPLACLTKIVSDP